MTAASEALAPTPTTSRTMVWVGRVLSGMSIAFFVLDAVMKFVNPPQVPETMRQLGWDPSLAVPLAVILLVCTAVYAIPRTAFLGAVLLTAYLGGAVATHVRVGSPLFTHVLFGVYVGMFVWGGLYLRDARVRALFKATA